MFSLERYYRKILHLLPVANLFYKIIVNAT